MKLSVLGKYGPYAPAGGATSGYLLENSGEYVLIDMGSGVLSRLQEYINPAQLKCVFISHIHNDHINDLYLLRYMLEILRQRGEMDHALKIVGPRELSALMPSPVFDFIDISEKEYVLAAGMRVSFARMTHPVPSMAMRFKGDADFVYSGDCSSMEQLADFAMGCDMLLCDAGTPSEIWTPFSPHLSAPLAAGAAQRAGASLILTHFMPGMDEKKLLKETRGICRAACAEERSCYEL